MKKLVISLGMASTFVTGSTLAYDGTINFTGKVVDSTCVVKTGSDNLNVILPTVAASTLVHDGATTGLTRFEIKLENCAANVNGATGVKAYFEPSSNIDYATHTLKNTASGSKATNVNIQLADGSNPATTLNIGENNGDQRSVAIPVTAGEVTLPYYAQYYATGRATAGAVASTINYTVAYE
ncbi:type 1 fimbrial protein [Escherichia coli]|uniref:fimbrial protein n=1 Tax=Escherichia coli TaxID=562 RepID=UPI000B7D4E7B|nr:fimbrial protein [Escherichia coli]EFN6818245.1 F17 fimbrial protein [Escherichia coli O83:H15]EFC0622909.1 type 1 fimbrial protein [Escherichia coli]EFC0637162.1 type 1 fimbrial protein [Escherichia coli]EFC1447909.1 type 1 fimbrial protein [Escherichia coli]EFC1600253.1 type 1 fimbrial protein [Escherichia coli]